MLCPYCGKDKPATEFTDEHTLPKSMGGKLRPTNPFKLPVCRPCNAFCGEQVDGPAASGFLGQLARTSVAASTDDGVGDLTPQIIPIGHLPGWTERRTICDLWLGPAGNSIFHFHRPYPGGDVMIRGSVRSRRNKDRDPGVVLVGVVPTNPSWFPLIVRSMKATFPRAPVYPLNALPAPPPELARHVAWIDSLPVELKGSMSIDPHAGERFAAKLALGIGSIFLGEAFQLSDDAQAFRAFIRGKKVRLHGLPPFAPNRGEDRDQVLSVFAWRRCHTIFLLPAGMSLSLVAVLYGLEPLSVPITTDRRLWEGKVPEGGIAWAVAPGLRRFVRSSVPEMLVDAQRPTPVGPLASLDSRLKAQAPLPPVHFAAG